MAEWMIYMKSKILNIELCDENQKIIDKRIVKEFEIREDYIINQSISRFSTDEPCIIYRTCIINSVLIKLEEFFRNQIKNNIYRIDIKCLPSYLSDAIYLSENVQMLLIR